ncbi:MAG: membrane dipeptidase, partial [Kofleriaceae bacterium]
VKEDSCYDVRLQNVAYQQCLATQSPTTCGLIFPTPTSQCWDFETGGLGDNTFGYWTASGSAFANQPTFGDNVAAWRVLQTTPSQLGAISMLDDLNAIGGDYWQTPYPIGHQGLFWLGTYENRHTSADGWSGTQGDATTGTVVSPQFVIDRSYLTFLIGGGCDANTVSIQIQERVGKGWQTSLDRKGRARRITGSCAELMERKYWVTDLESGLWGKTVRLVVTDAASGAWGHINIDHVLLTDRAPDDLGGANQPLWGFADTHSHLGNHLTFQAMIGGSHALVGAPEEVDSATRGVCDGADHGSVGHHGARTLTQTLETQSFGIAPALPVGCDQGGLSHAGSNCSYFDQHPQFLAGDGWHDATLGSTYWYTRTHQQMYLDWIKRSFQGGQRLLVASAGNAEALGMVLRAGSGDLYVSDYGAMRRFAAYVKGLVASNPWMEIAYTPSDARRIIRAHHLAIVLQTEIDDIGDNCHGNISDISYPYGNLDGAVPTTTSTNGANPWDQVKVKRSCGTDLVAWEARVESLYAAGYRMIIPLHFANNDLGGPAVYTDLHNTNNRFMTSSFLDVTSSSAVDFRLGEAGRLHDAGLVTNYGHAPNPYAAWGSTLLGWCTYVPFGGCLAGAGQAGFSALPFSIDLLISIGQAGTNTPTPIQGSTSLPAFDPANPQGHENALGLSPAGVSVLMDMKARGMLLDVSHMSDAARDQVLGLHATPATDSIINPGCDLAGHPDCLATAYPVISSHSGLREMQRTRDEGAIDAAVIERIRATGGTLGVGTAGGDSHGVDEGWGGFWPGIFSTTVANDCAGSSKTFAQEYLYALRRMAGKGITLGTDINGFESQLNPRFGSMGCFARGNVPWIVQWAHTGTALISQLSFIPFDYDESKLFSALGGTAGAQRLRQRTMSFGLNYAHYNYVPPNASLGSKFFGLSDAPSYESDVAAHRWSASHASQLEFNSMSMLSMQPPLHALTSVNGRTFDFNYDGLANYGMLPDMLQDTRADGLTNEQLGPLFAGAEAIVETWEKSCSLSDPAKSTAGCHK